MEATTENAVDLYRAKITALQVVEGYQIATPAEAEVVAGQLKSIHTLGKDVEAAKRADLAPIAEMEREVRAKWAPVEQLAAKIKGTAQAVLGAWQMQEQRRIAEENAARARAAAAERARLEEAARREREQAEAKAAKQAESGKEEKAQATLHAAEVSAQTKLQAAALVEAAMPKVEAQALGGVRMAETWEPTVVDIRKALAALVADEFVDLESLVEFKKSGLNALARQYKDKLAAKYPGLKADIKVGVAATGRK